MGRARGEGCDLLKRVRQPRQNITDDFQEQVVKCRKRSASSTETRKFKPRQQMTVKQTGASEISTVNNILNRETINNVRKEIEVSGEKEEGGGGGEGMGGVKESH